MHSQFKDQVFRKDGSSYLVLNRDPESPDWLLVKKIGPAREVLRMHRDEVAGSLKSASPLRAGQR